ncbi:MAG: AzlD domain-containing protein [Bacillota bacterium]
MTDNLWLVVLGMGAVTYIPRMLPVVLLNNIKLPPRVNSFLRFIPYAALSALIFPGVINSTGSVESAVAGSLASVILALLRINIMLVVLGGIAGVLAWELLT